MVCGIFFFTKRDDALHRGQPPGRCKDKISEISLSIVQQRALILTWSLIGVRAANAPLPEKGVLDDVGGATGGRDNDMVVVQRRRMRSEMIKL